MGEDKVLSIHDLKFEPPKKRMTLNIGKQFPNINEIPNAVRWSPLDMNTLLAFSSNQIIIALRGNVYFSPIFSKQITFKGIVDAEFLPFAGDYLAILSENDGMIHIIDWAGVNLVVQPKDDNAQYKAKSGTDQLFMCGLHINER